MGRLPRLCTEEGAAREPRIETIQTRRPPCSGWTQPFGEHIPDFSACMPAQDVRMRNMAAQFLALSYICAYGRPSPPGQEGRWAAVAGASVAGVSWHVAWLARWLVRKCRCRSTQAPICNDYMIGLTWRPSRKSTQRGIRMFTV